MTPTTLGAEKQHGSSTDTISKMDGVQLSRGDTITMTPELFEKLYFSPPNVVKGDLRKTFANPTPVYAFLPERTPCYVYVPSVLMRRVHAGPSLECV